MTVEAVAETLEISDRTLARWEAGRAAIRPRDLRTLLDLYSVNEQAARTEMEALAREGRQRGWWTPYTASVRPTYATWIGLESEAAGLWEFSATLIPGLLQTEQYTRAVMRAAVPEVSDAMIEKRISLRRKRFERLTTMNPLRLHAVLDESCLRRLVGGREVMDDQLQHLLIMAEYRHITLQVLPFAVGAHAAALGAFSLLTFPHDPPVAMVEVAAGDLFAEGPDTARYTMHFDKLRETALPETLSLSFIRGTIGEG